MAQWLACWAHIPKVPGSKSGSAMFVLTQEWPPCSAAGAAVAGFVGLCVCWLSSIGLILLCMSFSIENVLEKYWFSTVLYCVLY